MIKMEKTILIAAMDCAVHSFFLKGKKNFTLQLKEEVLGIEKIVSERQGRGASKKPV